MDIVCDCAGELEFSKFPCKAEEYSFPVKLLLQHPDGVLEVAGESPTLAEIQVGIGATGVNKLIVIEQITNGQRTEAEREEESGADTADGLTDTFGINMTVTGRVKLLNEEIRKDAAVLNCQRRLNMWFVTNTGWIFGGKTGYKIANFIPPLIMEGFGVKPYLDLNLVHKINLNKTDPAGQNDGFLLLMNPAVS